MHDVVLDLHWIAEDGARVGGEAGAAQGPSARRRERVWIGLALLFLVAAAVIGVMRRGGSPPEPRAVSASIVPPDGASFEFVGLQGGPPALSPDGRSLAFTARGAEGATSLWVRPLDRTEARKLAGTGGATSPFWSPDSSSIAFFADGKLKKIAVEGGPAIDLCDAPDGRGGSWNAAGAIVFAPSRNTTILRVASSGGVPTAVTRFDPSHENETHRWPAFLPDGRHFLFFARHFKGVEQSAMISIGTLDGDPSRDLFPASSNAISVPGYVLFMHDTTLMAQAMDASGLEPQGEAFPVAEKVQFDGGFSRGVFSASPEGTLVYQTGLGRVGSRLVWYDRAGAAAGEVGEEFLYLDVEISPDGRSVAVASVNPQIGPPDIWIHDLSRGVRSRFTFDPRADRCPVWSHDGARVAFRCTRTAGYEIRVKDLTGPGAERVLFESAGESAPTSWSRDGRLLLFQMRDPNTRNDLWVLTLPGDRKPTPFLQTTFNEESARFSPDGRWVTYVSDESGRDEIYVTPFPGPGRRLQVSANGGTQPRWRSDGQEIFFISNGSQLMTASVQARNGLLEVGQAKPLFKFIVYSAGGMLYDVSADGRRFLVITASQPADLSPLTLRLNWTATVPHMTQSGQSR
jgi:Tol biopolymer transport system component